MDEIETQVKRYILSEFLPDEDPNELTQTTPLITSGIVDSLGTLRLVSFLEDEFKISLEAHEADSEYLNTIEDIGKLVRSKGGAGG